MRTKLFFLFSIIIVNSFAQSPNWQWAKSGIGQGHSTSTATDGSNNVYVTGYFISDSITFGSTVLHNSNSGYDDIFLVKYDANGNVLWAKSAGGTAVELSLSVSTDIYDNVYITGTFGSSTITFGTVSLYNLNPDPSSSNVFVVKYDPSGNAIWARSGMGGGGVNQAHSIYTDVSGNVYITGEFDGGSIYFDGITLTGNGSSSNMFIVKYDSNGGVLWAKTAGGASSQGGNSVTTDMAGNAYVTGVFFDSTIVFGSTILNPSGSYSNMFIAKYDASGNILWAKNSGGTGEIAPGHVTVDASGNAYVIGGFQTSAVVFGSTTLSNVDNNFPDIFLVKYDVNGNVVWAKSAGSNREDGGNSVITDNTGNIYITGSFMGLSITFGTITLSNSCQTCTQPTFDVYVVKYNPSGNAIWAKMAVGISHDNASGIAISNSGNIYVTGEFESNPINFGSVTLSNTIGVQEIFLAKLDAPATGINEMVLDNGASIYPNPFNSSTDIQLSTAVQNAELTISNVYGQTVRIIKNISGDRIKIDRGNLPNGIYFILLSQKNQIVTTNKLVITD